MPSSPRGPSAGCGRNNSAAVCEPDADGVLPEVVVDQALAVARGRLDVDGRGADQLAAGPVELREAPAGLERLSQQQRNRLVVVKLPAQEDVAIAEVVSDVRVVVLVRVLRNPPPAAPEH